LKFQIDLKGKLLGTWTKFKDDPSASTFLKAFGPFHVATLETKEVSTDQLVLEEIRELRTELAAMHRSQQPLPTWATPDLPFSLSDVKMFRQQGLKDAEMHALWEGMRKFREAKLIEELQQMTPDRLPLKKTGPDLEQEHTKSNQPL
jgi:hypothetical protein